MTDRGWIMWPQGLPERAVFCDSLLAKHWWIIKASFAHPTRRQCSMWPAKRDDCPVVEARNVERRFFC